jgi:hypothetical protein
VQSAEELHDQNRNEEVLSVVGGTVPEWLMG